MTGWTDAHCRLRMMRKPSPSRPGDPRGRGRWSGTDIIVVGVDADSSRRAVELSEQFAGRTSGRLSVGTRTWRRTLTTKGSKPSSSSPVDPKTVAVGGMGLDFHWSYATLERQLHALDVQLHLAENINNRRTHCRRRRLPSFLTSWKSGPCCLPDALLRGNQADSQASRSIWVSFRIDGR